MNWLTVLSVLKKVPRDIWFVAVIIGLVVAYQARVNRAEQAAWRSQIVIDGLFAAADTTRVMHEKDKDLYIRRAVQAEMKVDALNKKLKTESSVRATLQYLVDSVYGAADVDDSGMDGDTLPDILNLPFSGYTQPYAVSGTATIDFVEDTAGVTYKVVMDPFKIGVRVECGKQAVNGVRPASMVIEAPSFVRVSLDTLRQAPEVCSPPLSVPVQTSSNRSKIWTILGFSAGTYFGYKYLK